MSIVQRIDQVGYIVRRGALSAQPLHCLRRIQPGSQQRPVGVLQRFYALLGESAALQANFVYAIGS